MILRLSQRLSKKIKSGVLDDSSLDSDPLADWTCRLFIVNRKQYIILCNTLSLYSCIMLGKGITNRETFINASFDTIAAFLEVDQQRRAGLMRQFVAPSSSSVTFSRSRDRSIIGSISDHVHGAKLCLSDGMPIDEVCFYLNETPMSALKDVTGRKYAHPQDVFRNALAVSHPSV